jgi:cyclophilin family peptidyl-prolyl cis-trans isomerase
MKSNPTSQTTFSRYCCLFLFLSLTNLLVGILPVRADRSDQTNPPFKLPARSESLQFRSAEIKTSKGSVIVKLFPESAPWHVENFRYLSGKGFYDNLPFHIFERNYVLQTGAPNAKANSGPGYTLPPEFNEHPHIRGALSMVRKPNDLDTSGTRRSHGSQFRIMLSDQSPFDRRFTVFGQVVQGFDVLDRLALNDRVLSITVFRRR